MNHVIEPTPDGAIGKAYLIELNWDIPPAQLLPAVRGAGAGPANGWDIVGRKAGRARPDLADIMKMSTSRRPVGWRFKKRDFIPSTSGADPAPLAPPRIPTASAPIDTSAPLAPAANYVAPTQQSSTHRIGLSRNRAAGRQLRPRARLGLRQGRERRGIREPVHR
jgi:hypothetical protein